MKTNTEKSGDLEELAPVTGSADGCNGGCPPDCGHTTQEHVAFDEGVISGRQCGHEGDNPYVHSDDAWEAWETGRSTGAMEYPPNGLN